MIEVCFTAYYDDEARPKEANLVSISISESDSVNELVNGKRLMCHADLAFVCANSLVLDTKYLCPSRNIRGLDS